RRRGRDQPGSFLSGKWPASLAARITFVNRAELPVSVPPAPPPSSAAVRTVMQGNRGSDTRPEVILRSALHRRGLRFRKGVVPPGSGVRCRADVVFPAARVVVFVDGCFWH